MSWSKKKVRAHIISKNNNNIYPPPVYIFDKKIDDFLVDMYDHVINKIQTRIPEKYDPEKILKKHFVEPPDNDEFLLNSLLDENFNTFLISVPKSIEGPGASRTSTGAWGYISPEISPTRLYVAYYNQKNEIVLHNSSDFIWLKNNISQIFGMEMVFSRLSFYSIINIKNTAASAKYVGKRFAQIIGNVTLESHVKFDIPYYQDVFPFGFIVCRNSVFYASLGAMLYLEFCEYVKSNRDKILEKMKIMKNVDI